MRWASTVTPTRTPSPCPQNRKRPSLLRCIDLITELSGQRPRGYVAPWWEFSHVTNELLLKHGIKYDHSLMHRDFECYYVRGRRPLDQD